jgi:hypothetical protein
MAGGKQPSTMGFVRQDRRFQMATTTIDRESTTTRRGARHTSAAHTPPWLLTTKFMLGLKWRYLANFPSDLAWMVLRRKYDAFTTDRAYDTQPRSWLGPLGNWADRRVLDYPVHVALRQRLELVTEELTGAVISRLDDTSGSVRVLSAPCGLGRDVLQAAERLRDADASLVNRLDIHCLDIDAAGDVIPEARRRFEGAGVAATFHRGDLFETPAIVEGEPDFDVVNCIGLAAWVPIDEVRRLTTFFRGDVLARGGTLLLDNFAWHDHSAMGADLEIDTVYHPPREFEAAIEGAGFRIERARETAKGVCTLYVATAVRSVPRDDEYDSAGRMMA